MDRISKYLEDKRFINWVFSSSQELDLWWEQYQKEYPQEKPALLLARKVLHKLKTKDDELSGQDRLIIFSEILKKTKKKQILKSRLRYLTVLTRYAAVALLFFSMGALLFYQKNYTNPQFLIQDYADPSSGNLTTLIRPDGKSIRLTESRSTISYQADTKKILINDSIEINHTQKQWQSTLGQLIVPFGKTSEVTLADGTKVYINAGSRLIYPEVFKGKKREVFLVGEAYFEVHKDKDHPFVVQTTDINIEVLGTKFNLSAYATDNVYETVLTEGKVRIRQNQAGFFDQVVDLAPNQLASFDRAGLKTQIREVDTNNYTLWKDGMFKFESADISRIVKKLERFYNIRFYFQDPLVGGLKISGKLGLNEEREDVLDILASTASVKIIKKGENYYEISKK